MRKHNPFAIYATIARALVAPGAHRATKFVTRANSPRCYLAAKSGPALA